MAERVFVPSKARRIILSWLANKRLRDSTAMLLLALSESVEQSFDDATLARIAGIDVTDLPGVADKLAASKWLYRKPNAAAASYALRDDGPLRGAWIMSSHMEPDDQA
jgi:hypothetical protein